MRLAHQIAHTTNARPFRLGKVCIMENIGYQRIPHYTPWLAKSILGFEGMPGIPDFNPIVKPDDLRELVDSV